MTAKPEPTPQERVEAVAADLGLTMESTFVPFSASRNAKPGADGKPWRSLNWNVRLFKAWDIEGQQGKTCILETDYGQGEGHVPNPDKLGAHTLNRHNQVTEAIERGRFQRNRTCSVVRIQPPALADVLYWLSSVADVLDHGGFESWAAEYGYDSDSRGAEATYRSCLEIALKLRAAIGDVGLEALRDACRDF